METTGTAKKPRTLIGIVGGLAFGWLGMGFIYYGLEYESITSRMITLWVVAFALLAGTSLLLRARARR